MPKERIYHIPQVNMYLKIIKPPMVKYGYVLFSQDSIFSSLDKMDYLKIQKLDITQTIIIINPNIKDELYIDDRFHCLDIHQINYKICRIGFRDTAFFLVNHADVPYDYQLKYPYMNITIGAYLDFVSIANYGEKYLRDIMPCK